MIKKLCLFYLILFLAFNASGMSGSFYKHDNGWIYTGSEIHKLANVLNKVKERIKDSTERTEWECIFKDVFENEYSSPAEEENRHTYFAWMQACIKRTGDNIYQ